MGEMPLKEKERATSTELLGKSTMTSNKNDFPPLLGKNEKRMMTFVWPVGQKAIELTLDKINMSQTVMLPTKPPWMPLMQ